MSAELHLLSRDGLIEKYGQRVPRYTSYPPANCFGAVAPDTTEDAFSRARMASANTELSVYVHFPFCKSMCRYCGCAAIVSKNGKRWEPYMTQLKREVEISVDALGSCRHIAKIHWGGGSPNWLAPDKAAEFFELLTKHFPLADNAEVAIEVDPKTLRTGQLEQIRTLGFNRISLGIQDVDPDVQAAIGRVFPEHEAAKLVAEVQDLDFQSINLDLMYGLPGQTLESFRRTVDAVTRWRPDRIALFGYAHVPWMRPHQRLLPTEQLPTSRERIQLFAMAASILVDQGYHHLGLDHFVLPNDELAKARTQGTLFRDFQGYSIRRATDLLGLGMSAIGKISGTYLANQRRLRAYGDAVSAGNFPTERAFTPSAREIAIAKSIEDVMCYGQLDLNQYSDEFGGPMALYREDIHGRLQTLQEDKAIIISGARIEVTAAGRYVLRHIAAVLDPMVGHADGHQKQYSSGL